MWRRQAFTNKNYNVTLHAAHRIVRMWPLSDYAPRAEYLIGRCLEMTGKDEAAFNAYQAIIQKYPHSDTYEDVLCGNTNCQPLSGRRIFPAVGHHPALPLDG